jgi:transposase
LIVNPSKPVLCEGGNAASTAEKKTWGRKRVLLVDTQGFLLAVLVLAANIGDREGAVLLLHDLIGHFPRISHLFADQGYIGPLLDWIKTHLGWETEILTKSVNKPAKAWEWEAVLVDGQWVPRPKRTGRGFQLQPQRWKIERTFGWLIRFRRLARDYEGLPSSSEAFIRIAAVRLFLTRLAPFRC